MQYLTSYFCVCLFVGFFAKSGTLPKEGGGREGAGSRRAERRGEAESGGPGGRW